MRTVPRRGRCIHVGDSWAKDVCGAHAALFEAVYVCPPQRVPEAVRAEMTAGRATPHLYMEDLRHFHARLGLDVSAAAKSE